MRKIKKEKYRELLKGEEEKQMDFCKLGSKVIWWKRSEV